MQGETLTQSRPLKPWLTRSLVAINVAVFAAMAASGVNMLRPDGFAFISWGSNFAPLTTSGEWWRVLSASCLHFGPLHLLFNMWALWSVGTLVERLFGHTRFVVLYLFAGVVAGLASVSWNPLVNSAGASGAIFGIIGAQLAFFLRGGHRIPAELVRAQRNSTLAFIGYSIVYGFLVPGIDNAAHLGGLVAGLSLGWLLARPLGAATTVQRDRLAALLAAAVALAMIAAGAMLAQQRAAGHAAEQAYLRDWRIYALREPQVLSALQQLIGRARNRQANDADIVDWLERTGIPFYQDASRRFSAGRLPRGSALAAEQARTRDFVLKRADAFELLADALRRKDSAALTRALDALGADAAEQGGDAGR